MNRPRRSAPPITNGDPADYSIGGVRIACLSIRIALLHGNDAVIGRGGGEARKDSKQQWQEHEIVDQAHGKQREI